MKTRVAKCGHLVSVHPGRQRRLCVPCREAEGIPPLSAWSITCWGCGIEAEVYHQSQKYCAADCRDAALLRQRVARIESRRVHAACGTCGASLAGRSTTAKFCSLHCAEVSRGMRLPAPLARRICALAECDVEFQPNKTGQRCCSERHGKMLYNRESRADGRQAAPKWDDRARDHYHRRRALKKQASTGEPVLLSDIRERDKGRCHLCGKRVLDKPWPHPMSPSLDHVIPLTKGGAHDPSNVKLAHLFCNSSKGNRGGGEQLMLIG